MCAVLGVVGANVLALSFKASGWSGFEKARSPARNPISNARVNEKNRENITRANEMGILRVLLKPEPRDPKVKARQGPKWPFCEYYLSPFKARGLIYKARGPKVKARQGPKAENFGPDQPLFEAADSTNDSLEMGRQKQKRVLLWP